MSQDKKVTGGTLTDAQFGVERRMGRRSFLTVAGVTLTGAVALATGACSNSGGGASDPDSKAPAAPAAASDPDSKAPAAAPAAPAATPAPASDPDSKQAAPPSAPAQPKPPGS